MVKGWKDELLQDMKNNWQQLIGDAPPQSIVGPAVSHENMGPDALRQLSPSDDREASRAQHKSGSKRAGSDSRRQSGSREGSSVDRYRARVRRPPTSPDSPSPTRHRSPPAKCSRRDRREMSNDSCSSEGRQQSTHPRRPWHLAPQVAVVMIPHILLHLTVGTGVARLPLVGPPGPAWLRGLLGVPPHRRRDDHLLITDGLAIHPGTVTHHLCPALGVLIIACPLPHLGRLHPKGAGPIASHLNVTPPGLPAWSVTPIHMIQTFISCDCGRTMMMNNIQQVHIHVIPLNQDNLHLWMPLSYLRKKCKNFWLTLSLRQPFRTTRIPSRIVLLTNSWYPMYARLLLRLQIYRTVNR